MTKQAQNWFEEIVEVFVLELKQIIWLYKRGTKSDLETIVKI